MDCELGRVQNYFNISKEAQGKRKLHHLVQGDRVPRRVKFYVHWDISTPETGQDLTKASTPTSREDTLVDMMMG